MGNGSTLKTKPFHDIFIGETMNYINNRKAVALGCFFIIITLLTGCSTRSISNSGYQEKNYFGYKSGSNNPFYTGELSEFEVLGINPKSEISDADIQTALKNSGSPLTLKKGSSIMLVQSGAMIPDSSMVDAVRKYYNVSVFSGVPQTTEKGGASYSKLLRLSAAKGGFNTIVCYWGLLESAQKDLSSKTISWLPILGSVVTDENQQMRIRLKIAIVDVKTGRWEMFSPKPFMDEAKSSRNSRGASDQKLVTALKDKSYAVAAEELALRYSR